MRQRLLRKFTADTLAMFIFSLATSLFGVWFEKSVADLSWTQMGFISMTFNPLKYSLAWLCARIKDRLGARLKGDSEHPLRMALANGIVLSVYEIPLYTACALLIRLNPCKVALMAAYYLAKNLSFGWLYGLILNWVRGRFAVYSSEL